MAVDQVVQEDLAVHRRDGRRDDNLDNFEPGIGRRSVADDNHAAVVDNQTVAARIPLVEVDQHFDRTYFEELVHLAVADRHPLVAAVVVHLPATMQLLAVRPMAAKSESDFAFDNWLEYVRLRNEMDNRMQIIDDDRFGKKSRKLATYQILVAVAVELVAVDTMKLD